MPRRRPRKYAQGGYVPDAQGLYNITLANGVTASLDESGLNEFIGRNEPILGNTSDVFGSDQSTWMDQKNALGNQWNDGGGKDDWYGGAWEAPSGIGSAQGPQPNPSQPTGRQSPQQALDQLRALLGNEQQRPEGGAQQFSPWGGQPQQGLGSMGGWYDGAGGGGGYAPSMPFPWSTLGGSSNIEPKINEWNPGGAQQNDYQSMPSSSQQRGGFAFRRGGRARWR